MILVAGAAPTLGHESHGWRAGIARALVVTLGDPSAWAIGLAGFLGGGGIVIVTWPILELPTPTGLQNVLGGPVSSLAFGSPSPALALLIAGMVVAAVLAVIGGTWIGAWAERRGIEAVLFAVPDERVPGEPILPPGSGPAPGVWGVVALRLLSLVPPLIAAAIAWPTVYGAAYRELLSPSELVTPLPIRVLRDVPGLLAGIGLVWIVTDAAAAVAVRRLVIGRRPLIVAWLLGWAGLVRRPHRVLGTALVGLGATILLVAPALLAIAAAWSVVRLALLAGADPVGTIGPILLWVATWLGALVVAGVASAFRGAAWTLTVGSSVAPAPRHPSPGRGV